MHSTHPWKHVQNVQLQLHACPCIRGGTCRLAVEDSTHQLPYNRLRTNHTSVYKNIHQHSLAQRCHSRFLELLQVCLAQLNIGSCSILLKPWNAPRARDGEHIIALLMEQGNVWSDRTSARCNASITCAHIMRRAANSPVAPYCRHRKSFTLQGAMLSVKVFRCRHSAGKL